MGLDDALRAIKLVEPRAVIPIHYSTFDAIVQHPSAWIKRVQAEASPAPVELSPCSSYDLLPPESEGGK